MALSDPWLDSEEDHPLTSETARFIARANCVAGIREYALDTHGFDCHLSLATHVRHPRKVRPPKLISPEARQLLRVAWQTELAARLGVAFDDSLLARVSAQTLPVQVYYAIFNGFRALGRITGGSIPTHSALQEDFAKSRAQSLPLPWSVVLSGDPETIAACELRPDVVVAYPFNPLERSHEPAAYLWTALRMARRWKIQVARRQWLADNKKRDGKPYKHLPPGKKDQIALELRATSLLDFVYELRRQAQYETADEYASDAEDRDVIRFHEGMLFLTDSGLLLAESLIAHAAGFEALREVADDWLRRAYRRIGGVSDAPLQMRLAAITEARE